MFRLSELLFSLHGNIINSTSREDVCAVPALGQPPKKYAINTNDFHCSAGHSHDVLLHKNAEKLGIVLEG